MDAEQFGVVLYRNRTRAGLSQAELAELMGTKQPAISRAERGRVVPTLEFIERWTKATGRPIELEFDPRARPDLGSRRRPRGSAEGGRKKPKWDAWDRRELPKS